MLTTRIFRHLKSKRTAAAAYCAERYSTVHARWLDLKQSLKLGATKRVATMWLRAHHRRSALVAWKARHAFVTAATVIGALAIATALMAPSMQTALEARFPGEQDLEPIRSLLLNLGGPLIGAVAIVSSLVLFAMQVNIERMPHRTFMRFSTDSRLLAAFAIAFALAVAVLSSSAWLSRDRLALTLLGAAWAVFVSLILFWYAYKRALSLISPTRQLEIIASDARHDLTTWARRAQRLRPLFGELRSIYDSPASGTTHDIGLVMFFKRNADWCLPSERAIEHAVAFARRYSEQGDYETAGLALGAVVSINASYVVAKGKTFFASSPLLDSGLSTDGFINKTLELLRQLLQAGLARGDEQQIELTLRALAELAQIYCRIDYCTQGSPKTHAVLAGAYLAGGVESVLPRKMVDVLMEGQRLLGTVARMIAVQGSAESVVPLSERIARVSIACIASEEQRPAATEGVAQLAALTFDLLRTRDHDIGFPIQQIRGQVARITRLALLVPDPALSSVHSSLVGPYYSSTSLQSLHARLVELTNALSEASASDEVARRIVRNIATWAEDLPSTEKSIMLDTIAARSSLTFDIFSWIVGISEMLMAVSNASACDEHSAEKLRKQSQRLAYLFTWIPEDEETVKFVENYQLIRTLFELGVESQHRGCDAVLDAVLYQILLKWTLAAGRIDSGWGSLDRGLLALAVLSMLSGEPRPARLKVKVREAFAKAPHSKDQRIRCANKLRRSAASSSWRESSLDSVERCIQRVDQSSLRKLLEELADIVSPADAH